MLNDLPVLLGGTPSVTLSAKREWPFLSDDAKAAISRLADGGCYYDFGRGKIVSEMEDTISQYHGGQRYVLATNSGTAALHSAFFGLGLSVGDEVICPSYTFHATMTPLFLRGVTPILCDSEYETGNIDVSKIEPLITPRTKAIVVTHLFGHPVDMDPLMELSQNYRLPVVEDCSQAIGARYKGRKVGTIGHVAAFSLGGAKMVTGGAGGALMTNEQDIYNRALLLGHSHERSSKEITDSALHGLTSLGGGENYRISLFAATIINDQFKTLDARIAMKTKNYDILSSLFQDNLLLNPPETKSDCTRGSWYGYKAFHTISSRQALSTLEMVSVLKSEGIRASKPSTRPIHQTPPFSGNSWFPNTMTLTTINRDQHTYEIADRLYDSAVGISDTIFHEESHEVLEQYAKAIKKIAIHFDEICARIKS